MEVERRSQPDKSAQRGDPLAECRQKNAISRNLHPSLQLPQSTRTNNLIPLYYYKSHHVFWISGMSISSLSNKTYEIMLSIIHYCFTVPNQSFRNHIIRLSGYKYCYLSPLKNSLISAKPQNISCTWFRIFYLLRDQSLPQVNGCPERNVLVAMETHKFSHQNRDTINKYKLKQSATKCKLFSHGAITYSFTF